MSYRHLWDNTGERCIKCGDKDWMGSTCCEPDTHVLPVNDFKEHEEDRECWCKPELKGGVVVHNAMDQRELIEEGKRRVQ